MTNDVYFQIGLVRCTVGEERDLIVEYASSNTTRA